MLYDDEALISLLYGKSRRGINGPKFPACVFRRRTQVTCALFPGYLRSRALCLSSQKNSVHFKCIV